MTIKQLTEKEWNEVASPISLCSINQSMSDFVNTYGLEPFRYVEKGLGELTAVVLQMGESIFWVRGPSGIGENSFTLFEVRSFEPNTQTALTNLCYELRIDKKDLDWIADNLGPAKWVLSRYDDNGNEIEMFHFHQEVIANKVQRVYEERGHKQAYFVRRLP